MSWLSSGQHAESHASREASFGIFGFVWRFWDPPNIQFIQVANHTGLRGIKDHVLHCLFHPPSPFWVVRSSVHGYFFRKKGSVFFWGGALFPVHFPIRSPYPAGVPCFGVTDTPVVTASRDLRRAEQGEKRSPCGAAQHGTISCKQKNMQEWIYTKKRSDKRLRHTTPQNWLKIPKPDLKMPLISVNHVVKTVIKHPPVITIYGWYGHHSQSWVVYGIVLTTSNHYIPLIGPLSSVIPIISDDTPIICWSFNPIEIPLYLQHIYSSINHPLTIINHPFP